MNYRTRIELSSIKMLKKKRLERDGIYKKIGFAIQDVLDICAIIMNEEDLKVLGSDRRPISII